MKRRSWNKRCQGKFFTFYGQCFSLGIFLFFLFFCSSERDFGFDNFYFPKYTRVCLRTYIYTLHIYDWKYIMRIIVVASSPSFRFLFPFCTFASFCWINYRQLAAPFARKGGKNVGKKKRKPKENVRKSWGRK